MPTERVITDPICISEDGMHDIVTTPDDSEHFAECAQCFERYHLVSETVLKKLGIQNVTPCDIGQG